MSKLHWHTELCGERVEPARWTFIPDQAGLVEHQGRWYAAVGWLDADGDDVERLEILDERGATYEIDAADTEPIFPPAGWAGRTDAELWEAVFGEGCTSLLNWYGPLRLSGSKDYIGLWVAPDGLLQLCTDANWGAEHKEIEPVLLHNAPALITALQNARVLAQRLQQEGK